MKRDMNRVIQDYQTLKRQKGGNFGAFYYDDIKQLQKKTEDEAGINFREIELQAIVNGLEAGFMIGYRAGIRDARGKRG